MNIHEYQAKELFSTHGVPIPRGFLARSPIEAEFAMSRLGGPLAVVKAQVHSGGRGKAGGVKVVKSPEEAHKVTGQMLGMTLVTKQTGPQGKVVHKVYVEEGSEVAKEYYLALLVDRETASVAVMFSTEGGMDIEEVAHKTPEKITTVKIDPTLGIRSFHMRKLTAAFAHSKPLTQQASKLIQNLYNMFLRYDCSLIEINPLALTKDDRLLAIDGKMNFDDNGLYRQPDIENLRDFAEDDPREIEASKHELSYIGLDGNIGCLVNGAGLAMATMDIIKFFGGRPANFLDVGGGATQETVTHAFRIILQDKNVESIFVNIFGGIMRCDVIANGIIAAAKDVGLKVPLIVRLEGTNVEQGKKILAQSGLNLITAENMADGGKKAVFAAKKTG